MSERKLPKVIDLTAPQPQKHIEPFYGYTLRGEISHFLFCNRRIFGDGCIGHEVRKEPRQ